MTIPIANVYYLLLYAWGHGHRAKVVQRGAVPHTELANLFADALATEAGRLLSHGLAREYVQQEVAVGGIRGKLDLSTTLKRQLLNHGQTWCVIDELDPDVIRNQIIKTTARNLTRLPKLDRTIRARLEGVQRRMAGVSFRQLSSHDFRSVQSHRNVGRYDFVLRLCRIVFDNLMVDEAGGNSQFYDFRQDDATMWQLFEDFVREFYQIEAPTFHVSRPQIEWWNVQGTHEDLRYLPSMQTDVVLHSPSRDIILDTKFYGEPFKGRFGQAKVRSSNLYQLLTYIDNRAAHFPTRTQEGVLLYPSSGESISLRYVLNGRRVQARTVDLMQAPQSIRRELLAVIE